MMLHKESRHKGLGLFDLVAEEIEPKVLNERTKQVKESKKEILFYTVDKVLPTSPNGLSSKQNNVKANALKDRHPVVVVEEINTVINDNDHSIIANAATTSRPLKDECLFQDRSDTVKNEANVLKNKGKIPVVAVEDIDPQERKENRKYRVTHDKISYIVHESDGMIMSNGRSNEAGDIQVLQMPDMVSEKPLNGQVEKDYILLTPSKINNNDHQPNTLNVSFKNGHEVETRENSNKAYTVKRATNGNDGIYCQTEEKGLLKKAVKGDRFADVKGKLVTNLKKIGKRATLSDEEVVKPQATSTTDCKGNHHLYDEAAIRRFIDGQNMKRREEARQERRKKELQEKAKKAKLKKLEEKYKENFRISKRVESSYSTDYSHLSSVKKKTNELSLGIGNPRSKWIQENSHYVNGVKEVLPPPHIIEGSHLDEGFTSSKRDAETQCSQVLESEVARTNGQIDNEEIKEREDNRKNKPIIKEQIELKTLKDLLRKTVEQCDKEMISSGSSLSTSTSKKLEEDGSIETPSSSSDREMISNSKKERIAQLNAKVEQISQTLKREEILNDRLLEFHKSKREPIRYRDLTVSEIIERMTALLPKKETTTMKTRSPIGKNAKAYLFEGTSNESSVDEKIHVPLVDFAPIQPSPLVAPPIPVLTFKNANVELKLKPKTVYKASFNPNKLYTPAELQAAILIQAHFRGYKVRKVTSVILSAHKKFKPRDIKIDKLKLIGGKSYKWEPESKSKQFLLDRGEISVENRSPATASGIIDNKKDINWYDIRAKLQIESQVTCTKNENMKVSKELPNHVKPFVDLVETGDINSFIDSYPGRRNLQDQLYQDTIVKTFGENTVSGMYGIPPFEKALEHVTPPGQLNFKDLGNWKKGPVKETNVEPPTALTNLKKFKSKQFDTEKIPKLVMSPTDNMNDLRFQKDFGRKSHIDEFSKKSVLSLISSNTESQSESLISSNSESQSETPAFASHFTHLGSRIYGELKYQDTLGGALDHLRDLENFRILSHAEAESHKLSSTLREYETKTVQLTEALQHEKQQMDIYKHKATKAEKKISDKESALKIERIERKNEENISKLERKYKEKMESMFSGHIEARSVSDIVAAATAAAITASRNAVAATSSNLNAIAFQEVRDVENMEELSSSSASMKGSHSEIQIFTQNKSRGMDEEYSELASSVTTDISKTDEHQPTSSKYSDIRESISTVESDTTVSISKSSPVIESDILISDNQASMTSGGPINLKSVETFSNKSSEIHTDKVSKSKSSSKVGLIPSVDTSGSYSESFEPESRVSDASEESSGSVLHSRKMKFSSLDFGTNFLDLNGDHKVRESSNTGNSTQNGTPKVPSGALYSTLNLMETLLKEEDIRFSHQKALLKTQEQSLIDEARLKLASIHLEGGSNVRKKQRAVLLQLRQQRSHLRRLIETQSLAAQQRKLIFLQHQHLLSSTTNISGMKLQSSRGQSPSAARILDLTLSSSDGPDFSNALSLKSAGKSGSENGTDEEFWSNGKLEKLKSLREDKDVKKADDREEKNDDLAARRKKDSYAKVLSLGAKEDEYPVSELAAKTSAEVATSLEETSFDMKPNSREKEFVSTDSSTVEVESEIKILSMEEELFEGLIFSKAANVLVCEDSNVKDTSNGEMAIPRPKDEETRESPGRKISSKVPFNLKIPLSPRSHLKQHRRQSSESDDSFTLSQNETTSDASDGEGKLIALREELALRKGEAERLQREKRKMRRERLASQEQALRKQISIYDSYIQQAKLEIDRECREMQNVSAVKPLIKKPQVTGSVTDKLKKKELLISDETLPVDHSLQTEKSQHLPELDQSHSSSETSSKRSFTEDSYSNSSFAESQSDKSGYDKSISERLMEDGKLTSSSSDHKTNTSESDSSDHISNHVSKPTPDEIYTDADFEESEPSLSPESSTETIRQSPKKSASHSGELDEDDLKITKEYNQRDKSHEEISDKKMDVVLPPQENRDSADDETIAEDIVKEISTDSEGSTGDEMIDPGFNLDDVQEESQLELADEKSGSNARIKLEKKADLITSSIIRELLKESVEKMGLIFTQKEKHVGEIAGKIDEQGEVDLKSGNDINDIHTSHGQEDNESSPGLYPSNYFSPIKVPSEELELEHDEVFMPSSDNSKNMLIDPDELTSRLLTVQASQKSSELHLDDSYHYNEEFLVSCSDGDWLESNWWAAGDKVGVQQEQLKEQEERITAEIALLEEIQRFKELHPNLVIREVPNKPPPPYAAPNKEEAEPLIISPIIPISHPIPAVAKIISTEIRPSENLILPHPPSPANTISVPHRLSKADLRKLASEIFSVVPTKEEDIYSLIQSHVELLHEKWHQGINPATLANASQRKEQKLNEDTDGGDDDDDKESNSLEVSINSFQRLLFDLTKELVGEMYALQQTPLPPIWKKTTHLHPAKAYELVKNPNKGSIFSFVMRKVCILMGWEPATLRDSAIVKWAQRKRDLVDQILVCELQTDEFSWTNYDDEEIQVKNELSQEILNDMIENSVKILLNIMENKAKNVDNNIIVVSE